MRGGCWPHGWAPQLSIRGEGDQFNEIKTRQEDRDEGQRWHQLDNFETSKMVQGRAWGRGGEGHTNLTKLKQGQNDARKTTLVEWHI